MPLKGAETSWEVGSDPYGPDSRGRWWQTLEGIRSTAEWTRVSRHEGPAVRGTPRTLARASRLYPTSRRVLPGLQITLR